MGDIIVLDLETQKSFAEVGGQQFANKLGVSVCVIYSYQDNKFRCFRENQLAGLEPILRQAKLIVGFNSKSFDFTVLQPYFPFTLSTLPHLDILEEITKTLGHRLKLESVAQATILSGKSGSGLDALWYFKNNDWLSLEKYCTDDVRVTRDVYEYGKNHGYLWYDDLGQRKKIPIPWGVKPTVDEIIEEAFVTGQQLSITYLNPQDKQTRARTIDLKSRQADKITAFDQQENQVKIFNLAQILTCQTTGKSNGWQSRLI